ncbi:MAG: RsmE family RNA methyltransferase [Verrucomicrobiota bacterium]|nr:RsmE family RNA methyltransferase [Verrucomicrobiota bacterium]
MKRVIRSFLEFPLEEARGEIILDLKESHHLSKVLRREVGDAIELLDGKGNIAQAECLEINNKSLSVRVFNLEKAHQSKPRVRMLVAMTKGGKFENLIKPLTELGVDQISPLLTDRSEVAHGKSNSSQKLKKWRKLAIEGCKQSGNVWLPKIDEPVPLKAYLSEGNKDVFMATLSNEVPLDTNKIGDTIDILIGPEGGWSESEENLASSLGVHFFSLGSTTLRTETAAIAALAVAKTSILS